MKNKLEFRDKIFLMAMGLIIAIGILMPKIKAFATAKPAGINSQGILEMGTDNSFDAEDIYNLYNESLVLINLSE